MSELTKEQNVAPTETPWLWKTRMDFTDAVEYSHYLEQEIVKVQAAVALRPSGLCRHVWETKCRTCGTDIKHWPELNAHVENICKRWENGRATEEEICFIRDLAMSATKDKP